MQIDVNLNISSYLSINYSQNSLQDGIYNNDKNTNDGNDLFIAKITSDVTAHQAVTLGILGAHLLELYPRH